jgi:SH3-like domain-containing protein
MKLVRVIKEHMSGFANPINVSAGTPVSVEDRTTKWPGWLWCATSDGAEGWVPSSYVKRDGDSGIVWRDYNANELTVVVGDVLEMLEEESSWLLCRAKNGKLGWVPLDHVEVS